MYLNYIRMHVGALTSAFIYLWYSEEVSDSVMTSWKVSYVYWWMSREIWQHWFGRRARRPTTLQNPALFKAWIQFIPSDYWKRTLLLKEFHKAPKMELLKRNWKSKEKNCSFTERIWIVAYFQVFRLVVISKVFFNFFFRSCWQSGDFFDLSETERIYRDLMTVCDCA